MKELTKRTISGGLYAGLLISTIYYSPLGFYLIVGLFSSLALWEFQRLINVNNVLFIFTFLILLFASYLELIPFWGNNVLLILSLIGCGISSQLMFNQNKKIENLPFKYSLIFCYLVCSCLFIPKLIGKPSDPKVSYLMIFYLGTWTNNSFAYLFGKRFGKTKLFPSISPKKSWEGYIGGMVATLVLLYFVNYFHHFLGLHWITLGLLIPFFATFGDFVQSSYKRKANVKDSGSLLPGHGGFYDRMDSVIFTAPFYYLFLKLIDYVP